MHVLEHFYLEIIVPIEVFGIDISITNLTISMFAAVAIFLILFIILALKPRVVPGKRQVVIEILLTLSLDKNYRSYFLSRFSLR